MNDWTLLECLIVLAIFVFFIAIAGLITALIDLWNKLSTYERPVQHVSPREWNIPKDDWDDRIMKE